MRGDIVRLVFIACALGAGFSAQGQTVPPIKPGLWQVHMEREVNGKKLPDASDRLKDMPPEKRAQIEAMMKQRGMDLGSADGTKVCYTRESLAQSPWANQQSDCKVDFSTRTASLWKWHSSCPKLNSESDGETVFTDSEHYTVKTTSVSKVNETPRNSQMTITAKWVGSDCGDVKPFDGKP